MIHLKIVIYQAIHKVKYIFWQNGHLIYKQKYLIHILEIYTLLNNQNRNIGFDKTNTIWDLDITLS